MTALIPESHRDLFDRPIIAAFGTVMPDSNIQITPVWCLYDGTHLIVNGTASRQKHRNILDNPHVTLMAFDPLNQFR
ncbi:MAG: pyridoxamine 5'-phosphate oxidase family protein, partial [Aggregatilineales bacterium]